MMLVFLTFLKAKGDNGELIVPSSKCKGPVAK